MEGVTVSVHVRNRRSGCEDASAQTQVPSGAAGTRELRAGAQSVQVPWAGLAAADPGHV